jgi:hypothetical protein
MYNDVTAAFISSMEFDCRSYQFNNDYLYFRKRLLIFCRLGRDLDSEVDVQFPYCAKHFYSPDLAGEQLRHHFSRSARIVSTVLRKREFEGIIMQIQVGENLHNQPIINQTRHCPYMRIQYVIIPKSRLYRDRNKRMRTKA